jgi:cytochrome c553
MKLIHSGVMALAIVASAGPSLAASMDASVRNCTWCHGTGAQGATVAPRLAGQRPRYVENQLSSFRRHVRDNPFSKQYMWPASANLDARTTRDLADYFFALPARAAADGPRELVARGRTIYENGIPDSNIVACAVCHGPKAEGVRQFPRLGGLSYSYLKRRLGQWREGYHASAEAPMPSIANSLPPNVAEAVAAYLSYVK